MKRIIISLSILVSSTSFATSEALTQATYDQLTVNILRLLITNQADIIKGENEQMKFCSAYALQNWLIKFSNDNLKLNGAAKMADDLLIIKQNNDEKLKNKNITYDEYCSLANMRF